MRGRFQLFFEEVETFVPSGVGPIIVNAIRAVSLRVRSVLASIAGRGVLETLQYRRDEYTVEERTVLDTLRVRRNVGHLEDWEA